MEMVTTSQLDIIRNSLDSLMIGRARLEILLIAIEVDF
jgi:hypothetical protein